MCRIRHVTLITKQREAVPQRLQCICKHMTSSSTLNILQVTWQDDASPRQGSNSKKQANSCSHNIHSLMFSTVNRDK